MNFDIMLDAGSPTFAEELRAALGLSPGAQLTITTPQFERTDGRVIGYFPRTVQEFDALKKLSHKSLMTIGCCLWDEGHYLYPKEWYWNIPTGYVVTDIFDSEEPFVPGTTDDDIRFGCLSYGFKV